MARLIVIIGVLGLALLVIPGCSEKKPAKFPRISTDFEKLGAPVGALALSGNGKWLAVGADRVFFSGQETGFTIELEEDARVVGLGFGSRDRFVVCAHLSSEANHRITAWDIGRGDGSRMASLPIPREKWINQMAVSPDGSRAAVSLSTGEVLILSVPTLEQSGSLRLCTANGNKDFESWIAFLGNPHRLVSGGSDRAVHVWDVDRRTPIVSRTNFSGPVCALAVSADYSMIAIAIDVHTGNSEALTRVILLDSSTLKPIRKIGTITDHIFALCFSPDGRELAVGCTLPQPVGIYDVKKGRSIQGMWSTGIMGLRTLGDGVEALQYSVGGRVLITGSSDGYLVFYDRDEYRE
jgi:WD40 repeat protein